MFRTNLRGLDSGFRRNDCQNSLRKVVTPAKAGVRTLTWDEVNCSSKL
jgi:hypothetical protein